MTDDRRTATSGPFAWLQLPPVATLVPKASTPDEKLPARSDICDVANGFVLLFDNENIDFETSGRELHSDSDKSSDGKLKLGAQEERESDGRGIASVILTRGTQAMSAYSASALESESGTRSESASEPKASCNWLTALLDAVIAEVVVKVGGTAGL